MEIGVFGGTFNPLHNGNLIVARQARLQLPLDKIIFVPNGKPPHKQTGLLTGEQRFELTCAGIEGEECMEVSRLEIDRPGITWSIDTLRELKKIYGDGHRLNFIIGEDNVAAFEQYDKRAEFFKVCRLLVAPRLTPQQSDFEDWCRRLPEAEIVMINCIASDTSSTQIKKLIEARQDISHLVPAGILRLIRKYGYFKPERITIHPAAMPCVARTIHPAA